MFIVIKFLFTKQFLIIVAEVLDLINRRSGLKFEDKFLNNNKICLLLFVIVFVDESIIKMGYYKLWLRNWIW